MMHSPWDPFAEDKALLQMQNDPPPHQSCQEKTHLCQVWQEMLVNIEQKLHELLPASYNKPKSRIQEQHGTTD